MHTYRACLYLEWNAETHPLFLNWLVWFVLEKIGLILFCQVCVPLLWLKLLEVMPIALQVFYVSFPSFGVNCSPVILILRRPG